MGVWVNEDTCLPCRECRRSKPRKGEIIRGVSGELQWGRDIQMEMTSSLHFHIGDQAQERLSERC